eukprot:652376-Rhodomonas_salina.2
MTSPAEPAPYTPPAPPPASPLPHHLSCSGSSQDEPAPCTPLAPLPAFPLPLHQYCCHISPDEPAQCTLVVLPPASPLPRHPPGFLANSDLPSLCTRRGLPAASLKCAYPSTLTSPSYGRASDKSPSKHNVHPTSLRPFAQELCWCSGGEDPIGVVWKPSALKPPSPQAKLGPTQQAVVITACTPPALDVFRAHRPPRFQPRLVLLP